MVRKAGKPKMPMKPMMKPPKGMGPSMMSGKKKAPKKSGKKRK